MRDEWFAWRERLLFKTPAAQFSGECEERRNHYSREFANATGGRRQEIISLLSEISIDMQSYLARWHLQNPENNDALKTDAIAKEAQRNCELLSSWGENGRVEEIRKAVGGLKESNLLKLSRMTDEGLINNRWGNDAATGLTDAIRKGAILVTTNPIMVNNIRKQEPAAWDKLREEWKRSRPDLSPEQRVTVMTMEVVLRNARELRPIYEATKGKYGYVNLQISPKLRNDAAGMVEQVELVHAKLTEALNGTPNVVFKIPGTKAGLGAVRRLTSKGIGVTITVNCSVDQSLAFAEVIEQGTARVSFLVMMTGRLDDPIADELSTLGVAEAAEVAKWASTSVIRKSYDILYRQREYQRSAILTASLRGPWNIEGSITAGDAPIFITCFPHKAAEYDSEEREIVPRINEKTPENIMAKLAKSKLFRQAYEVGGLTIHGFDTFYPVLLTLKAFIEAYEESVEYMT